MRSTQREAHTDALYIKDAPVRLASRQYNQQQRSSKRYTASLSPARAPGAWPPPTMSRTTRMPLHA